MLIEIVSHADHFNFQAAEPLNHVLNNNTKNTDTDSSGGNRYSLISTEFIPPILVLKQISFGELG